MKIRLAIAALLVASFAALGFSRSALAGSCSSIDGTPDEHEVTSCTSAVTVDAAVPLGGAVTVTPVADYTTLPLPPKSNGLGDAVTVWAWNANGIALGATQYEICFADPSASGNVYMWSPASSADTLYTANLTGMWMRLPTYHLAGTDCANSWYGGTFTRN